MANHGLFTNCGVFTGGYNISGVSNAVSLILTKEVRDRSVFGVNAKQKGTGLESVAASIAGFYDASQNIESEFYGVDTPVSLFIPSTGGAAVAAGDRAFFFKALESGYKRGGAFGQDEMFAYKAIGDQMGYPIGIGYVLNPGLVAVTDDDTPAGAIKELGAVAADQYLYAVLHVTEVSADDEIVVTIESDALEAFGSPTTQITFSTFDAIGSEIAVRVPGPITDTWWRAYANVTGADVSIKYACAMAIR